MELFVDEQSWRPTASEKPPSESCVDHGDFPGRDEITLHSSIARMPRTLILAFVPAEHSLRRRSLLRSFAGQITSWSFGFRLISHQRPFYATIT